MPPFMFLAYQMLKGVYFLAFIGKSLVTWDKSVFIELFILTDNHNYLVQMLFETKLQEFKHFLFKEMKVSDKIDISST